MTSITPEEFTKFISVDNTSGRLPALVCRYGEDIRRFLTEYCAEAQKNGAIIAGGLANPTPEQLKYYTEMAGQDFRMDAEFFQCVIGKLLPGCKANKKERLAEAMLGMFTKLQKEGKTAGALKNTFVKFMCWMYYRLGSLMEQNGNASAVLYEGEPSTYGFLFLRALCLAGCSVVILSRDRDAFFKTSGAKEDETLEIVPTNPEPFPDKFGVRSIMDEIVKKRRITVPSSTVIPQSSMYPTPCTNAWMSGDIFHDLSIPAKERGQEENIFYNAFCEIEGVDSPAAYQETLYRLAAGRKSEKHGLVIVNKSLPTPDAAAIAAVKRDPALSGRPLFRLLAGNFSFPENNWLETMVRDAFCHTMEEEAAGGMNGGRLTALGVYMICWLRSYAYRLWKDMHFPQVATFYRFGGSVNEKEAAFFRLLSMLPVDMVVFRPEAGEGGMPESGALFKVHLPNTARMEWFPEETGGKIGTVAYHAEQELDTILYQDTGMYREKQFATADSVILQSMEEEIPILWDQELRYRPGFSSEGNVRMPVFLAKISGVKDGNTEEYWKKVQHLTTVGTQVIRQIPKMSDDTAGRAQIPVAAFLKNKKLRTESVKNSPDYPYGFLREEVQNHILKKTQQLLDTGWIHGTWENGTEYTIVASALSLDKETLRLIQNFDFTKKNPKRIYLITGETQLSLRDTIEAALLHLIGFDILFFIPTGYRCVERYWNDFQITEYQSGPYQYDLRIPDFTTFQQTATKGWFRKFLGGF